MGKPTVPVVEDNEVSRQLAGDLLARAGWPRPSRVPGMDNAEVHAMDAAASLGEQ